MELVESAFPEDVFEDMKERSSRALRAALDKTVVDKQLHRPASLLTLSRLFPYLFAAVGLLDEEGLTPDDIDTCMSLWCWDTRLGAADAAG